MISFLQDFLTESFLRALGWSVLHSAWQILLFSILLRIIILRFEERSPALIHNIGLVTLVLPLGIFIATFFYYYEFPIYTEIDVWSGDLLTGAISSMAYTHSSSSLDLVLPFISGIWIMGVCLLSGRLIIQCLKVHWYRRKNVTCEVPGYQELLASAITKLGVKRPVALCASQRISTPILLGHLKPLILLPTALINQLSIEETEAIIFHELAHIKRNDYLIGILQSLLETIFFFHPAFWWMSQQVKNYRELACDQMAVKYVDKLTYSKSLMKVAEFQNMTLSPKLAMSAAGNKKSVLYDRIERILTKNGNDTRMNGEWMIPIFILLLMVLSFSPWAMETYKGQELLENQDFGFKTDIQNEICYEDDLEGRVSPRVTLKARTLIAKSKNNSTTQAHQDKEIQPFDAGIERGDVDFLPQKIRMLRSKYWLADKPRYQKIVDFLVPLTSPDATLQNEFVYNIKTTKVDTLVPSETGEELRAEIERLREDLEVQREMMREQQRALIEQQHELMREMHMVRRLQMEHHIDSIKGRIALEREGL